MKGTVIVPLDGSAGAERAIPLGAGVACREGGTLRLIHVHAGADDPEATFPSMQAAERYMKGVVDRFKRAAPVVCGDVMRGGIVTTLNYEATAGGTGWLVFAAEARSPGFGRVGRSLIGATKAPMLVCGPAVPADRRFTESSPMSATVARNVVIVLDGSSGCESALPQAMRLARLLEARLTLVSVAVPGERATPGMVSGGSALEGYLDAMVDQLDSPDLPVSRRVLRSTDAASALMRAALEEDADAIAFDRSWLRAGSYLAEILAAARQPLLL